MPCIYRGDTFCDSCCDEIKASIKRGAIEKAKAALRDGVPIAFKAAWNYAEKYACPRPSEVEDFWLAIAVAINEYPADPDDEHTYDSDDYPKYMSDDDASDSPMHCGSHETCLEAITLPSGRKVGALLGGLTEEGVRYVEEYVEEQHGDPSEVTELWVEHFRSAGYDIKTDDDDE